MLEIDIDVRWLAPLLGQEAREEEAGIGRIDTGDAQAIADRRIRRRPPPLAQNALLARPGDNVMHGEEIGRIVERLDQGEFAQDELGDLGRNSVRIAPGRPLPGQTDKMLLRRTAGRDRFVGIDIGELVQAEAAARRDVQASGQGGFIPVEQVRHVRRGFEMALGIRLQAEARRLHRAAFPDTGQHVLQRAPGRRVIERVLGRHQGHAGPVRQGGQFTQPGPVTAAHVMAGGQVEPVPPISPQAMQERFEVRVRFGGGTSDENLPLRMGEDIFDRDPALPFRDRLPHFAPGNQRRQPPIRRPVRGITDQVRPFHRAQSGPDQEREILLLRGQMGPHHTGQRVQVTHAQGLEAQGFCGGHHLFRMGGPAQEGEIRHGDEFGISGHANSPWINQAGGPPRPSP